MDPTKALQDEDLARLARSGSDVAFRILLERYEGRLEALVPRQPRSQREDLVQEAHLGFLQAVRQWDPTAGRSFAATARRTAREAVMAALRHARQDATQHAVSLDLPVRTANEDEPVLPLLEILSVLGTEAVVLARCALRKRLRRQAELGEQLDHMLYPKSLQGQTGSPAVIQGFQPDRGWHSGHQ